MSVNINIHPSKGGWKRVYAHVFHEDQGACVYLGLDENSFNFHYGSEKNKNDFILKLKEAINGLTDK